MRRDKSFLGWTTPTLALLAAPRGGAVRCLGRPGATDMKRRSNDPTRLIPPTREMLRDPAVWAWIAVALLAILPARAVLAGS